MRPCVILCILLPVLAAGCIFPEIQKGTPLEYELPGINDTTIFYLNDSTVQVVGSVSNSTTARIVIGESGEMNFRNPVAVDYTGNNVTFNISMEAIFGRSYARFDFDSPFSGFVAYTQSDGQDFSRPLIENGSVRVVLPADYTTGSRFLGIPQPEPDNITIDSRGREVLTWNNPYPVQKEIKVKYYHKSAPSALFYFLILFVICALMILVYYYLSLKALKEKIKQMEKSLRK